MKAGLKTLLHAVLNVSGKDAAWNNILGDMSEAEARAAAVDYVNRLDVVLPLHSAADWAKMSAETMDAVTCACAVRAVLGSLDVPDSDD